MQNAGAAFMLDCCTVFWRMLRLTGWFAHPTHQLSSVEIIGGGRRAGVVAEVQLPHAGVERALGENKGFSVEILFAEAAPDPYSLQIAFTMEEGTRIEVPLEMALLRSLKR
ncbi:MAG: hypothetical protein JSR78_07545 [Proteobacteria bacterium]|nr:hypothetical protein [Pseudomonadota bacterium]